MSSPSIETNLDQVPEQTVLGYNCIECGDIYLRHEFYDEGAFREAMVGHHQKHHPELANLSWAVYPSPAIALPEQSRPEPTLEVGVVDNDPINPNHYKLPNGHETIEVTENLNGNGAQAVNYIVRATRRDGVHKTDRLEDLKKAMWFIDREIQYLRQTAAIAKFQGGLNG